MSSYYWHKGFTDKLKSALHNAVDDGNADEIQKLLKSIQPIFIGSSNYGWKFTWAPHDFQYFLPNVNSFLSWLKSADFISDDNGIKMSPDEFLTKISNDIYNESLLDYKTYAEQNPNCMFYTPDNSVAKNFSLQHNVSVNNWNEFYLGEFLFNIFVEDTVYE